MVNFSTIVGVSYNSSDSRSESPQISRSHNKKDHILYDDLLSSALTTIGPVGAGNIIFEAALVPGILLSIAAIAVSGRATEFKSTLFPIVRSTIRSVQTVSQEVREIIAETQEKMDDILAEIEAEQRQNSDEQVSSFGARL